MVLSVWKAWLLDFDGVCTVDFQGVSMVLTINFKVDCRKVYRTAAVGTSEVWTSLRRSLRGGRISSPK